MRSWGEASRHPSESRFTGRDAFSTGPRADRINLIRSEGHKYWFHASAADEAGTLSLVRARTTDAEDNPVSSDVAPDPGEALADWERRFWRFLESGGGGRS